MIYNKELTLNSFMVKHQNGNRDWGNMAEAIRTTVVPIKILIRTTVVPITPLIGTTVVRIRILIGTTGI